MSYSILNNIKLQFVCSMFGFVLCEMLRSIKFFAAIEIFAGSGLGYFKEHKDGYKWWHFKVLLHLEPLLS